MRNLESILKMHYIITFKSISNSFSFLLLTKVIYGVFTKNCLYSQCNNNMCPLIRRLLFNLYGNQQFQIRWNNCLSKMYNMTNGVKQGAVLSSILFTMYIDGLFYEPK